VVVVFRVGFLEEALTYHLDEEDEDDGNGVFLVCA
jgi:hypothetical protein